MRRVLVAGIGNLFKSDDGFGAEVARRLNGQVLPAGVKVVDYGIRGLHLAYDLLDGWDCLIIIDTVPSRGEPGTVHVLRIADGDAPGSSFDPHGMDPASMLAGVTALGGTLPPTVLVGCEPTSLADGIGLSPPVEAAVDVAGQRILALARASQSDPAVGVV